MNRSFKLFYKQFKKYRKKTILKLFYDYIREDGKNEKSRKK